MASKLGSTYRLTALDCFEDDRETWCAAAWVKDPSPVAFDWGYDLKPADVDARVAKDRGKLISIRAYKTKRDRQRAQESVFVSPADAEMEVRRATSAGVAHVAEFVAGRDRAADRHRRGNRTLLEVNVLVKECFRSAVNRIKN